MSTAQKQAPGTSEVETFVFDYEDTRTVEGRGELRTGTRDLAALRLERCLDAIKDTQGKLLEIGCGAGRYTRSFLHYRPDLEVHGCDISHIALDEAKAADTSGKIQYKLGDALNLPYGDDTFDIVLLFDVFEHVTDVGKAADEVARVLKPGGVFHCFVPCEGNRRTIFAVLRNSKHLPIHRWKRDHIGHIQILTTRQMQGILEKRGLRVTDTTFSFHLLGQIHDVADYWRREMLSKDEVQGWKRAAVKIISRAVFIPTWRLAYFEDTWRKRDKAAIGVHITCEKRQ
ncbi:MAG TPA: class I SAM-dependent methyltransferase [Chloroflexia bacterium]|nr:class I SAM-dependent methyltransferase [Chloroflexia bacterium]